MFPVLRHLGHFGTKLNLKLMNYFLKQFPNSSQSEKIVFLFQSRSCFMFRSTGSKNIKVSAFIRPLANASWFFTIFFIILGSIEFAFFLIHENSNNQLEKYSISFLLTIGSLCQQGTSFEISI